MEFDDLRLVEPILRAVRGTGYVEPTPIQAKAIPPVLDGRDLLGCAQTGTGKTAAFTLPILQRLDADRSQRRGIRALVVTPTRELAAQIDDSIRTYGKHLPLRSAVIFGGVSQVPQVETLRRGVDILVATPGRLLDLLGQGVVRLDRVEVLVLDEADRMLDMGFLPDVRRILDKVPSRRQTLLFSATMPPEIRSLATGILRDPVEVAVAPPASTADTIAQHIYLVTRDDKQRLLTHLLRDGTITKALVFTRTKHGADRVVKQLARANLAAAAIHGNKSQNQRLRALDAFKRGSTRVLVASDLASRGLDIDDVSHVVNFDLPNEPEVYVHRIGRTGRAGATGIALSFCSHEERGFLLDIEKLIRAEVPVIDDHPFAPDFDKLPMGTRHAPAPPRKSGRQPASGQAREGGRSRRRSGGGRGGQPHRDARRGPAPVPAQTRAPAPRAPAPSRAPAPTRAPAATRAPAPAPAPGSASSAPRRPSGDAPRPLPLSRPRTRSWRPGR